MTCISCGMPMRTKEEHAMSDPTKDYCIHCARPDGLMQSYEEKVASMTRFIVNTQGLEENAARETAKTLLAKQPAWQHR